MSLPAASPGGGARAVTPDLPQRGRRIAVHVKDGNAHTSPTSRGRVDTKPALFPTPVAAAAVQTAKPMSSKKRQRENTIGAFHKLTIRGIESDEGDLRHSASLPAMSPVVLSQAAGGAAAAAAKPGTANSVASAVSGDSPNPTSGGRRGSRSRARSPPIRKNIARDVQAKRVAHAKDAASNATSQSTLWATYALCKPGRGSSLDTLSAIEDGMIVPVANGSPLGPSSRHSLSRASNRRSITAVSPTAAAAARTDTDAAGLFGFDAADADNPSRVGAPKVGDLLGFEGDYDMPGLAQETTTFTVSGSLSAALGTFNADGWAGKYEQSCADRAQERLLRQFNADQPVARKLSAAAEQERLRQLWLEKEDAAIASRNGSNIKAHRWNDGAWQRNTKCEICTRMCTPGATRLECASCNVVVCRACVTVKPFDDLPPAPLASFGGGPGEAAQQARGSFAAHDWECEDCHRELSESRARVDNAKARQAHRELVEACAIKLQCFMRCWYMSQTWNRMRASIISIQSICRGAYTRKLYRKRFEVEQRPYYIRLASMQLPPGFVSGSAIVTVHHRRDWPPPREKLAGAPGAYTRSPPGSPAAAPAPAAAAAAADADADVPKPRRARRMSMSAGAVESQGAALDLAAAANAAAHMRNVHPEDQLYRFDLPTMKLDARTGRGLGTGEGATAAAMFGGTSGHVALIPSSTCVVWIVVTLCGKTTTSKHAVAEFCGQAAIDPHDELLFYRPRRFELVCGRPIIEPENPVGRASHTYKHASSESGHKGGRCVLELCPLSNLISMCGELDEVTTPYSRTTPKKRWWGVMVADHLCLYGHAGDHSPKHTLHMKSVSIKYHRLGIFEMRDARNPRDGVWLLTAAAASARRRWAQRFGVGLPPRSGKAAITAKGKK